MSISIKNISVSIGGASSNGFNIKVAGGKYHLDNFTLSQRLLTYNSLSFTMCKDPEEEVNDPQFAACGELIGKEVNLHLSTLYVGPVDKGSIAADVEFRGFIVAATGNRSNSYYSIHIEALSWDALLDDNPSCKSFENKTLNDIVNDVIEEYSGNINPIVNSRFAEEIPYCVQYNETNYQFLQRLARRYGEWMYYDGTQFVFGNLVPKETATLVYPSQDVPSYNADLRMQHVAFNHVASSYNSYDANQKDGLSEMQKPYNPLSEKAFAASKERFTKQTYQNLHSGGFAKPDSTDTREEVLNISTKTQGRGEKAGMLTYSGSSYCSCLKLGSTLLITDNYLASGALKSKSDVSQYEILITELVHHFSITETYSNYFTAIPSQCDYPPYTNSDIFPTATSCRAKVKDNNDPNHLGRIRVQFDWQRIVSEETGEELLTPWLRMAQPYAGGGKGFSFIPEIGEEVMIDFEGGNAERPFVKGTLYNGVNDVDHKWVANSNSHNQIKAIRTRNGHTVEIHDEGNDGYIRIYDNEKENYILTFSTDRKLIMLQSTGNIELYAKNDIIMHAGHDMKINVGNDRTLEVEQDDSTTVGNNQSLQVDNNQDVQIGNNQKTAIQQNNNIKIGGNQTIDTKGNKDERIVNTSFLSAKDYREEIDDEVIVVAKSQQYKSSSFTKIDGGSQIDIKAAITKVN